MPESHTIDGLRSERAVREVLLAIGEDPGRRAQIMAPISRSGTPA